MKHCRLFLTLCFALAASALAPAQGMKTVTNHARATVTLTLFVRAGSMVGHQAGTTSVDIAAGKTVNVQYGNKNNVFLNGYSLSAGFRGDVYEQHAIVTSRSSDLDNQLNTNSIFEIRFVHSSFVVDAHN
jgi:hypothetical protein